jgi:hypothetical protein
VDWYALITVEFGGMTDAGIRRHAKLKRLRALAAPHAERLADLETYVRGRSGAYSPGDLRPARPSAQPQWHDPPLLRQRPEA